MTLGTLLVAWLLVAALFLLCARYLQALPMRRPVVLVLLAEAAVLTLLAGLWFGSLGHGGWLLVFLLLGALVSGAERALRAAVTPAPRVPEGKAFALSVLRYVVAGALLAWRLG